MSEVVSPANRDTLMNVIKYYLRSDYNYTWALVTGSDDIDYESSIGWYNGASKTQIKDWDVSAVTDMLNLFDPNQSVYSDNIYSVSIDNIPWSDIDISGWETSNVENMKGLFFDNTTFNKDISGWDTSKVTNMRAMFHGASAFNQDISGWNTSNVTNMEYMFQDASAFNQDISGWRTSKVTNMEYMFYGAIAFDQPGIRSWNVSSIVVYDNVIDNNPTLQMFYGTPMFDTRYMGGGGGFITNANLNEYFVARWIQLGDDIDGEAAGDLSGYAVSLSKDGSIVAIGAPYNDGATGTESDIGQVRLYEWDGTTWNKLGEDINGVATDDQSGYSVSLSPDGTRVAIGAPYNDGLIGLVRIYERDGTRWNQLGQDLDGESADDQSGYSVSLSQDGSIVAIGAVKNGGDGYPKSGHVRIYELNGSVWIQLGDDIDGEAAYDWSGSSVSLSSDGTRVAIGAPNNDGLIGDEYIGQVRIYEWDGTRWNQLGQDIDGEAAGEIVVIRYHYLQMVP